MNNPSIGIMQGRLTPTNGRGIQFFPFDSWEKEFFLAQKIGLDEIEWIFDWDNFAQNPLWSEQGIENIKTVSKQSGTAVNSICFDYFMHRPFYKVNIEEKSSVYNENVQVLSNVIKAAYQLGAHLIEIPMVDNSSVKSEQEREEAIRFLQYMSDIADEYHIMLGLETDFPPIIFRTFLEAVNRKNVVANYDSGNSAGLGYNHTEELLSLDQYVYNVHIKDRMLGGATVELGLGSADFEAVFTSLRKINYTGSIILQAARNEDGKEIENIKKQINFIQHFFDGESHCNLDSYNGVEAIERFDNQAFIEYCENKLSTCKKHVNFIKSHIDKNKLNVCEIGSGNGKLLYQLEKADMLKSGTGYEVSKSRWEFAEKFKRYMHSDKVVNLNQNILQNHTNEKFDLIIGVDIVFQIIAPLYENAQRDLILWIKNHCIQGGYVLLEFMDCVLNRKAIADRHNKNWTEFPCTDPFQYMLTEVTYDSNENIRYDKIFVPRGNDKIETMTNIIKPYTENEISTLLMEFGFKSEIFYYYENENDIDEGEYIVLAKLI